MKFTHVSLGLIGILGAAAIHAATPPATVPVDAAPIEPWKPTAFSVPEGFEVEVVAAPPLVEHPMMGSFDDRGRLYLAEASGQNLKFEELQKVKPNYVRRLEDTDGDGRFDKTTIFADKMEFPQGALWHEGAVYVASPPSIWKLVDANDDGVADQRIELVNKFGSTGNAADIHGCFLSPTGRIYWVDGYHGHEIEQHDKVLKGKASYIFSCKPDGSDVRVHCGGGMDNPTEIDWTETGELIGDVNILLRNPRVDCLVHWMYGGSYPHREAAIAEFKITGERLGPLARFGHVAVSGCIRLRSDYLGAEFKDNFLTAQFNTQKVLRSVLTRSGSTFTSQEIEFIKALNPDSHITDIIEDADGSLLIIDTGGWFRIGCPTSQIAKPSVLGGVYRLKKKGGKPADDPRGLKIAFDTLSPSSLVQLLADPRFVVREKAIQALVKHSDDATGILNGFLHRSASAVARRNAIWTLTRIDSPGARAAVRFALDDADMSVRLACVHSIFETRDEESIPRLARMVVSDEPAVRREAATALGRIGKPAAVPAIFKALESSVDRTLEHALIYALIEIDNHDAVAGGLASGNPAVRRAALLALDQMSHSRLTPQMVLPELDSADPAMRTVAVGIVSRRTDWVDAVNQTLASWLGGKLSQSRAAVAQAVLSGSLSSESTRSLIGSALGSRSLDASTRLALLGALASGSALAPHASWIAPINESLASGDNVIASVAISAAAAVKTDKFAAALKQLGSDTARAPMMRVAALRALGGKSGRIDGPAFDLLVAQLGPGATLEARMEAARMLGESALTKPQLQALTPHLATAGPLELPALLGAYRTNDPEVTRAFVEAVEKSPGLPAVTISQLKSTLSRFPQASQDLAEPLLKRMNDAENQKLTRLNELEPLLSRGDAARGKQLFDTAKGTCIACHRIKGTGGLVGPDLSQIGRIRQGRDLLEAIVFPSASFARSYEPWLVTTTDGQMLLGSIPTDSAEAIELMPLTGTPLTIPRKNIKSMVMNTVSVMPMGLDRTMTEQELADLIAYMKSLE